MGSKTEGRDHYINSPNSRSWYHRQWKIWPERADDSYTTSLSFHYGGVMAYRELNEGKNPEMSGHLQANVEWLDKRG